MTNAKLGTSALFAISPITEITHFVLEPDALDEVVSVHRATGSDLQIAEDLSSGSVSVWSPSVGEPPVVGAS